MKRLLTTLAAVTLALPALAQPSTYYVAGDFNGWNVSGNAMTETSAGSGIWQATLDNVSAGRYTFKITGGNWDWNYPGPNSWLYAPGGGSITISYDVNTHADGWLSASQRIGVSADPGTWTAAGDFQGWNNAAGNMTSLGNGIYSYQQVLTPGAHSWKAVKTGTWDAISSDTRSVNTANYDFTVVQGAELVTFYVDALNGTVKLGMAAPEAVPEPSTFALLGAGLAAGFWWRRRRL